MPGLTQIDFHCDVSELSRSLHHFWEHTVGSGHAQLALRADWQAQLTRCHNELGFQHVRFHAILCDHMGTLIDNDDRLLYSFHNADVICDFLVSIGMKPFVELSFMPEALASGSATVFHYRGNVTPPKHLAQWETLIEKLATHWIDRYGAHEVRQWFFEVWNEPNLKAFWPSTQLKYFHLYRATAKTLKKVDPQLQVGGPATASDAWIAPFLDFCRTKKVPCDFVSTHHYPTDALGNEDEDTESQLASSSRNLLQRRAQDTRAKVGVRPLYYTEWNTSSNPRDPLHDDPYAAAVIVKTMMEANGLVEGYSFWTFSDIFSENYFPSVPFQGGFGLLNLYNIAKPSYRAFQLLHRLGNQMLVVDGIHETVDCWAIRGEDRITLLLTNFALPRHPIATHRVNLNLESVKQKPARMYLERIDDTHANAKPAWRRMGTPEYLSASQVHKLQQVSELVREPVFGKFHKGRLEINLVLPPQSTAAVTLLLSDSSRKGAKS